MIEFGGWVVGFLIHVRPGEGVVARLSWVWVTSVMSGENRSLPPVLFDLAGLTLVGVPNRLGGQSSTTAPRAYNNMLET